MFYQINETLQCKYPTNKLPLKCTLLLLMHFLIWFLSGKESSLNELETNISTKKKYLLLILKQYFYWRWFYWIDFTRFIIRLLRFVNLPYLPSKQIPKPLVIASVSQPASSEWKILLFNFHKMKYHVSALSFSIPVPCIFALHDWW